MNRRDFLAGGLAGLVAGIGIEKLAGKSRQKKEQLAQKEQADCELPGYMQFAQLSFAQQGEDLIINSIFKNHLMVEKPTFIDIGAYHPIYSNNTYLLYLEGSRGVLVEPNPEYTKLLKSVRQEDTVLNIGIGITDETEADYYTFGEFSQLNTFSRETVDRYIEQHGPDIVKEVIKLPLVNINTVLEENFKEAPNLFSIDVEGLDLEILQTLDFNRFRPNMFCIETSISGTSKTNQAIFDLMQSHDYIMRGNTYSNSIFVDNRLLSSLKPG